jgi:hypothetical protein
MRRVREILRLKHECGGLLSLRRGQLQRRQPHAVSEREKLTDVPVVAHRALWVAIVSIAVVTGVNSWEAGREHRSIAQYDCPMLADQDLVAASG